MRIGNYSKFDIGGPGTARVSVLSTQLRAQVTSSFSYRIGSQLYWSTPNDCYDYVAARLTEGTTSEGW